eukprot:TRINITY_DN3401_c0_g1_i1.p1 TRINITY_DN3401_c0_g1~~TRINITY_DN3401_c0_g1_i1.p1  ORF type:complete len:117 (-),score=1.31 TRINITY_DN3401_c0_g1_i1:294-644(-)
MRIRTKNKEEERKKKETWNNFSSLTTGASRLFFFFFPPSNYPIPFLSFFKLFFLAITIYTKWEGKRIKIKMGFAVCLRVALGNDSQAVLQDCISQPRRLTSFTIKKKTLIFLIWSS